MSDAIGHRWATFMDKVRGRVREIEAEARAAYAEVIAVDAVDGTALSGVSSAIKARMIALRQKVDDAWSTIDAEIDKLDGDARALGRFRGVQCALGRKFGHELERQTEEIILRGEADAARALLAVAQREMAAPLACAQCGAQLARTSWHAAVNVTCPHCKAVTTATPGTAAMSFARGSGAISLAREAAMPQWRAMQDAEDAWRKLRYKTLDDLARWEAANVAYWRAYATAMAQVHPEWTAASIDAEVSGKMSWFRETVAKDDRTVRENNGAGLAAVHAGDGAKVQAWTRLQRDPGSAAEDLLVATIERGWMDRAKWLAQVCAISSDDFTDAVYRFETRGE